jgi:hypothetical protein
MEFDPSNDGYTHAGSAIYLDRATNPTSVDSIVVFLKCVKNYTVGICYRDAFDDTMTGAVMEPIMYAYLSGI